jgi:hypothetical protein
MQALAFPYPVPVIAMLGSKRESLCTQTWRNPRGSPSSRAPAHTREVVMKMKLRRVANVQMQQNVSITTVCHILDDGDLFRFTDEL